MSYPLIIKNFVDTNPYVKEEEIINFSFKRKENGEQVGIVKIDSGITYIKRITPDGLDTTLIIKIPLFFSIEDRNNFIMKNLYNNYTQADIAMFLNMSQSQISNIIRKYRNNEI